MIKDCILFSSDVPQNLRYVIINECKFVADGVSCNYINDKPVNIIGIPDFDKVELNEKYSLNKIIKKINPSNLFEIALCMKIYNDLLLNYYDHIESEKEHDLKQIFYNKFKHIDKYKEISSLLSDSRGWIVWRYQVFNILSLAVSSSEKIDVYIKGLNAKKLEIIEELQYLNINDFAVYDIIQKFSLPTSSLTYIFPNLRDASIINNELKLF